MRDLNRDNLVEMGSCRKPHGIKGGFSLQVFNKNTENIKKGSRVFLTPYDDKSSLPSDGEVHIVSQISWGNKAIIYFKNIGDRNLVEQMIPFTVWMDRDDFEELDEDEFYLSDLVGLKVIDEESGAAEGEVTNFYENGVQVVLEFSYRGKSYDLPLVENFFPEINWDTREIFVNLPEMENA